MSSQSGKSMTGSPSVSYTERGASTRMSSRKSKTGPSASGTRTATSGTRTATRTQSTMSVSKSLPTRSANTGAITKQLMNSTSYKMPTRSGTTGSSTVSKSGKTDEFHTYAPSGASRTGSRMSSRMSRSRPSQSAITNRGNTTQWNPVTRTYTKSRTGTAMSAMSATGSRAGTMTYDAESGRPSAIYMDESFLEEEKKSSSCCWLWLLLLGVALIVAFLLIWNWEAWFGTPIQDEPVRVAVRVNLQNAQKLQNSSAGKIKRKPQNYAVWNDKPNTSGHGQMVTDPWFNKTGKLQNKQFWVCSKVCKNLFDDGKEGGKCVVIDQKRLQKRERFQAYGKPQTIRKACLICKIKHDDAISGRGRGGEILNADSSDEMGRTGAAKQAANYPLKEVNGQQVAIPDSFFQ